MATASRTTLTLLAVSAGLMLALSGCSAAAPASHSARPTSTPTRTSAATSAPAAQSTAAACAQLKSSVETVAAELKQGFAGMAADPAAAEKKLKALADSMAAGLDGVTDPAVKEAGTKAHDALAALDTDITSVLANPKTADVATIQADATAVQTSFTALGTICG